MEKRNGSLKEILKINFRGVRLINERKRSVIPFFVLRAVGVLLQTYWNLWFLAMLVDDIEKKAGSAVLVRDAVILVGGDLLLRIMECVVIHIIFYLGSNVWEDANVYLNEKMMEMDYEYMESEKIQNRKRDLDEMVRTNQGGGINFLFWRIEAVLDYGLNTVVSVCYMLRIIGKSSRLAPGNPVKSALYGVGFVLLILCAVLASMKRIRSLRKEMFLVNDQMIPVHREISWYEDNYLQREAAGKNIRLFHQQPLLERYLEGLSRKIHCGAHDYYRIEEKIKLVTGILQAGALCFIYFYLGMMVVNGLLSIGNVILYAGSISVFVNYFSQLVATLTELAANTRYLKAYFDFLDIPNRKYQGTLPVEKRDDDQFELEFRNVSFRYPGSDQYVLRNFSIRFRIGERLAVVGRNGSGKTTFIKLLCRLYDPTEGEILLNGINIKKYDVREYAALFSVVFQDFQIISLPLGENVAAAAEVDEERALEALEKAGFSGRPGELANGLETVLYTEFDPSGVNISGGEAQKIAIARALYHDTPFIILDEPTAALDPLAEYEVYSKFDELVGSKTAVYISHRLSSCRFCNDILVIDGGRAVQRGSHEKLVQDREGLYYRLWSTQAQYYE